MLELIQSGQGNLMQSLIFIISTAGFNLNAPMYMDEWPYAKEILADTYRDEQYFAIILNKIVRKNGKTNQCGQKVIHLSTKVMI